MWRRATQAAAYLAGNARERDPNPKQVPRASEPEDPTDVEGPITDMGNRSPDQGGAKRQKLVRGTRRRFGDGQGRSNSRKRQITT